MEEHTKDNDRVAFRRKRVKIFKRILYFIIVALLVLPMILSVYLLVQVNHLQDKIDKLSSNKKTETSDSVVRALAKPKEKQTKKVYLTFEDGPSEQTESILDVLKKEKVKATFFVVGHTDAFSKKMYKRIVKEGHTLGMHSYSHLFDQIYYDKKSFEKDLSKLSRLLYDTTGEISMFYRFPGGSSYFSGTNKIKPYIEVLNKYHISYVDWNVIDFMNTKRKTTNKKIVSKIIKDCKVYPVSVVQLHDSSDMKQTKTVLLSLIKQFKNLGYELDKIDTNTKSVRHYSE